MRVIVAGGGTGGHAFPALAIIDELRRRDPQLALWYLGKPGNIEERMAAQRGIPFRGIVVGGLARRGGWRNLWPLLQIAVGCCQAGLLLLRFRPQVVIGTGGYVSVPPVIMAALLRIPTVIHEQNSVPGRANRLLSRWATAIAATFVESVPAFAAREVRVVGNPVRADLRPEALATVDRAEARRSFGLEAEKLTLLVVGGSQGARALTDATLAALAHLPADRVQVLLMTGADDAERAALQAAAAAVRCEVRAFIEDMAAAYVAADAVICRAGASTLAEVSAAGLPAILVPYPFAVSDHQRKNAEAFAEGGGALLLPEDELSGAALAERLHDLIEDPAYRRTIATASRQAAMPDAAEALADLVCDVAIPGSMAA